MIYISFLQKPRMLELVVQKVSAYPVNIRLFCPRTVVAKYAHAQVHPGGMFLQGIRMGRWAFETTSKRLRLLAPFDAENQSTTGDSGGPQATGQAASRLESPRGIAQPAFQSNRAGKPMAPPDSAYN